jgi:acyl-CoA synthetase (AMP-forming)/AMP-acid ligase II
VQENFVCRLEASARRRPAKTALSWSELDRLGRVSLPIYPPKGLRAGDRIAIVLPNHADFVIAFLAILKLGASAVPHNPQMTREERAAFIADLKPNYVIDHVRARPGSFVSLKPNARCTAAELTDYCKQHLAHYRYPRTVNILPELPKGPSGKFLKSQLRASAQTNA